MNRALQCLTAGAAVFLAACNSTTGNGNCEPNCPPTGQRIYALNSVGGSISQLVIDQNGLSQIAADISLGANHDGVSLDMFGPIYVTSTSEAGGSTVLFGNADLGDQLVNTFPGANPSLVDPSKPTMAVDLAGNVTAPVAGRGTNHIYIATPAQTVASLLAVNIGEYVERVLPASALLVAIDANLDDVTGTFEPLGPPAVHIIDLASGNLAATVPLTGAVGMTEALFFQDILMVLAGGGFGPAPGFAPEGNGNLALVRIVSQDIIKMLPIDGNGISMKGGLNGNMYIVRTNDFVSSDILEFSPASEQWLRGPDNPIVARDGSGQPLNCWAANALADDRLLCLTFVTAPGGGKLYLLDSTGSYLDDVGVGSGSTDFVVR